MKQGVKIGISVILGFMLICVVVPMNVAAEGKVGNVYTTFSSKSVRQDESGYVDVELSNTGEDQIRIKRVGIHFDWMDSGVYFFDDNSASPVMMAEGQTQTFRVSFSVEKNTPEGSHSYNFLVEYDEDDGWAGWSAETWTSTTEYDFDVLERDRDGDGVGDSDDAFPDNSGESKDSDEDGVGNNQDAFPYDPLETSDSDGDGIGDNSDNYNGPGANPPSGDDDTSDDDTSDNEKKDSSDSPGFELIGVVLAIGLCVGVIGWRKRKRGFKENYK